MRVTTWTEYSLIISLHLARRGGTTPVAARELADQERLPADYVEQILLRLRRAGLVESVRGARGGYYLAREPERISVRDVMAASEHQTFEVNCDAHPVDAERCAPDSGCSIRPVWYGLQARVDEFLASISLADLMKTEPHVQSLVSIGTSGGNGRAAAAPQPAASR
ncbi:MAG: Rrf2 family transcriptional regulator [Gemmatimonadales bacterium]|nr:Rrf2 family transcriptional regulator [Gemmatimonadales bacterium]